MPKKTSDDNAMVSETGNWNVADDFSRSKIMRPLIMADEYEDIATFGYDSIIDEIINYASPPNDVIRIKAFERYIKILIRVIDNSKFALKKSNTRKEALGYKQKLLRLQKAFNNIITLSYDSYSKSKILSIVDHDIFDDLISKVSDIKSKINEPLNKNHLIFVDKEEFDPKAFKKNIKDRMINKG